MNEVMSSIIKDLTERYNDEESFKMLQYDTREDKENSKSKDIHIRGNSIESLVQTAIDLVSTTSIYGVDVVKGSNNEVVLSYTKRETTVKSE